MARHSFRSVALLACLGVAACVVAALVSARLEHGRTSHAAARQTHAQLMLTSLLQQSDAAGDLLTGSRTAPLSSWGAGATGFATALNAEQALDSDTPPLRRELTSFATAAHAWQMATQNMILRRRAGDPAPTAAAAAGTRRQMATARARYVAYVSRLATADHASVQGGMWLASGLVCAVALLLAAAAVALVRRSQVRERSRQSRLAELRELLQVSASEAESRQLLLRHLRRLLGPRAGAGAAVLTVIDSENLLEPTLGDAIADTPLHALPIASVAPSSCLAIRLGRPHARGRGVAAGDPLLACEMCGRLPGEIACEPLRVSRRTLGAVLVASNERLGTDRRAQLHEAAQQAAPILAIQRNLELAEHRAASDPLTGLPNRRAADEAIRRLTAQSGRTISPLAVILVDLDRFKQINDRHGHPQGDRALTAIAQVLGAGVRASDFVARFGGEEFLVLAPDTDRQGAIELAEKLRASIDQMSLPVIGRLTASFGVAALPDDAVDPEQLLRRADRALYAAKALGRNQVQPAETEPTRD